MHPAFSILFFTTLAGAAQGLVVVLAVAVLAGLPMTAIFLSGTIALAFVLLVASLGASFLHLGRKTRAWRAALMWRTSWMSREVILLPAFIALVAIWWLSLRSSAETNPGRLVPVLLIAGALALWYCTAMIYSCLRFIEEWAHPLTIVNYTLIGLSSGLVLACALAAVAGEAAMLRAAAPWAFGVTLLAWTARWVSIVRNRRIRHRSSAKTATGIQGDTLVQKSMGMSAGAFNTREFFHGASRVAVANIRLGLILLCFALPSVLILWGLISTASAPWLLAALLQAPGLIAERWTFFAEARHPQNLYYQTVS